jgi:RimJ/RimL family protein N-acetyltransferase
MGRAEAVNRLSINCDMRTELSGAQVWIRRYRAEDVALLFEAARESISDTVMWLPWCHPNYSLMDSTAFILSSLEAWERGQRYDFAVFDVATNIFLGGVGLSQPNWIHRFANLGYWTRSSCRGRGVAVAAARLAARLGFEDLGLSRLEIVIATGNQASQRVAEKAGAKREGVLRNRLLIANRPHDAVMYSLVPADMTEDQR